MRWHGWARAAVVVALAPAAVSGQGAVPAASAPAVPPLIDSLQHASLAALGRQARDTDSVFVRTLVTSPDPQARMGAANSLIFDSTATPLLLAYLVQEKNPRALKWPLYNISYPERLQRDPRVRTVLRYLLETSADSEVVATSVEGLRSLEMRELETTVTARLLDAKKRGDDSLVHALLATEDRAVTLERGIMLPTFLRRAPAPFVKHVVNPHPIRVLAFGDFGTGSVAQTQTAAAMVAYHKTHPFDFGLTLGDNFYARGMASPNDPRWQTQWEELYSPMHIPFYAVLGNHDWSGPDSPAAEILYSAKSQSWHMPSPYYTFTAGPVQFFAFDTPAVDEAELKWLDEELTRSTAPWKVVYGHYHIFSATRGDNKELIARLLPILKKDHADVYLNGHDHNLQELRPEGSVHFFVSGGGGAGLYEMNPYDRSVFRQKVNGFTVLEADSKTLAICFIGTDGSELYRRTLTK